LAPSRIEQARLIRDRIAAARIGAIGAAIPLVALDIVVAGVEWPAVGILRKRLAGMSAAGEVIWPLAALIDAAIRAGVAPRSHAAGAGSGVPGDDPPRGAGGACGHARTAAGFRPLRAGTCPPLAGEAAAAVGAVGFRPALALLLVAGLADRTGLALLLALLRVGADWWRHGAESAKGRKPGQRAAAGRRRGDRTYCPVESVVLHRGGPFVLRFVPQSAPSVWPPGGGWVWAELRIFRLVRQETAPLGPFADQRERAP
jgi:hypothetical protein